MAIDIKVSVLIPVYGVEEHIERCARSLFNQTMKDGIEFIFTDDCTPDRSIEILENVLNQYPERQSQVRIIHHEVNKGLAVTRMTGLKAAQGEYVIHCDSDDWVKPNMYHQMYSMAQESGADIIGCDYSEIYSEKTIRKSQDFSLPKDEAIVEMIKGNGKIEGFLWNRLVKREFYLNSFFSAESGITLFEDMAVTIPMHLVAKKVAYVPSALYCYNKSIADSMSTGYDEKKIQSAVRVLLKLQQLPLSKEQSDSLNRRLEAFLFIRLKELKYRDVKNWELFELPIINCQKFELTKYDSLSLKLVKRRLYRMQYFLVKIVNLLHTMMDFV